MTCDPIAGETMLAESMRLAQAGDRRAYAVILEHCRETFSSFARERCPARFSKTEVVRECLLTVHHARHTFDPKRSFSTWIDDIARHHGIGRARGGARSVWRARVGMFVHDVMSIVGRRTGQARRRPSHRIAFDRQE